jgi:hypothetical protein
MSKYFTEKLVLPRVSSIPGGGSDGGCFSSPPRPDRLLGPLSLIQWVPGGGSYFRVKRPGREAEYPPLSSSKVKNAWNHTSTPQYSSWSGAVLSNGRIHDFT